MNLTAYLLVFVGGGVGAAARFALGQVFTARGWSESFPWHTWLINVLGSCVLGIVTAMSADKPQLKFLLAVGFCGGFTTFSTFSLETWHLIKAQRLIAAIGYVLSSVVAGLTGVWLGLQLESSKVP
jgi:fluoride exporter